MSYRAIVIGMRGRGRAWAGGAQTSPHWELAACVDIDTERLRETGETFGLSDDQLFTSHTEAFAKVEADAAFIATPMGLHYPMAVDALDAGLHVLCEKSLTFGVGDAKKLRDKGREVGRIVQAVQNYRYIPITQTLKQLLDSGEFGTPYRVHLDFYRHRACEGYRTQEPSPLLYSQGVHHLDAFRYLLGGAPDWVFATYTNPAHSWYENGTVLDAMFHWSSGLVADYSGSYVSMGRMTGYTGLWRVECDRGGIYVEMDDGRELVRVSREPDQTPEEVPILQGLPSPELRLLDDLATAIDTGQPPPTGVDDNLNTIAMIDACILSSQRGQPVQIAELLG